MAIRTAHDDDDDTLEEQHAINVTPLIDVMLVLLIVFMIAAPLATVEVPVELPASGAAAGAPDRDPILLTLGADLSLRLDQQPIAAQALRPALDRRSGGDRDRRILLRADRRVAYADLMGTLDALRAAGYLKIALVAVESPAR
ncbi:biopolymer transporter ExbD [Xanthomonas sontii]|uniref:Biopolymer transporter ExbD n=1 Tax=Xanthomonas sontii TaxID=2650745 RepID=A0A6N7Q9R1_9XANT|nr:biopolymer transporter ExbD [Xanthomonas sontii]MRG99505.1 biopolymer transporter ExbD [Xanthomonas sontii]MRH73837.1 biopolymer transporter ExbD [Xanthomonas sontii]